MSESTHTPASASRQTIPMDVDVDDRPPVEGDSGDEESRGSESSGLDDDGSGDDYREEDEEGVASVAVEPTPQDPYDLLFQRIAGYMSNAPPGGGSAGRVGGASFQQDLAVLDDEELPQMSKRPARRRLHRAHRPTYEVQQILGRANMAYITQNQTEAVNLFLEVIRHDPNVQSAWKTLATIYDEMGDKEMSRQMRFCSAHIDEDVDSWCELALEFRVDDNPTQALYCLRKALKMDGSRLDVIWQLVDIYRMTGQRNKAVEAFRKIHRADPSYLRDFNMVMEIHPLIAETKQYAFGATVYGDAFTFHFATFDSPEDPGSGEEKNTMTIEHIVIYVDYLLKSGDPETAIGVIHRGQRWLQGRKDEKGWDAMDDDSEYHPREEGGEGDDGGNGGCDLDNQLRYRLAIARLRLGQDDEAMIHVNFILQLDAMIHGEMFKEMGEALMKRQLWDTALECWALLHDRNIEDEPAVIFKLGVCQHHLKRNAEALESLKWVVDMDRDNTEARLVLASVLEDMGKKTEALEIVSEVIRSGEGRGVGPGQSKGERASVQRLNKRVLEAQAASTMNSLWDDVQIAEEGINDGEPWALDKFIHAAGTMIETFRLAKSNFTKNRGITRVAKKRKYGSKNDLASQAIAMQDRLERTLGFEDETPIDPTTKDYEVIRQTSFYGIEVEGWLSLTIKYCCVLMVKSEEDVAMDILEHVVWSGLFNSRRCEIALRLTIIACAMRLKLYDRITDNCKRLSQMHQFRPEPLLLMLATLGGGHKQQAAWHNLAFQKFLHREVRIYDEAVTGVKLRFNVRHQRWAQILNPGQSRRLGDLVDDITEPGSSPTKRSVELDGAGDGEDEDMEENESTEASGLVEEHDCPKPTKHSPVFNTLYGQNMLTTKSYQSALFYFLRAYETNEYDPFLCFLIAQAFFGRSLNRQSDNRNFQVAQGLAFLARYRQLSPQNPQAQEEVEYNYGRSFHSLGITHLAATHYERVLTSVRTRMAEAEEDERRHIRETSLAWEAAHNLVLIYTASESLDLVHSLSNEWLALVD